MNLLAKLSPDAFSVSSSVVSPPCDLGGLKQHSYFIRKYVVHIFIRFVIIFRYVGEEQDYVHFGDVFNGSSDVVARNNAREWHHRPLPTTALLTLEVFSC